MLRRFLVASLFATIACTVQAEQADQAEHAVAAESEAAHNVMRHAVTQETCTIGDWVYDEVRSDCRLQVRVAPEPNPALKGICTIFYGVRTCY